MLYITSDHGGFQLKERIKSYLEKREVRYIDVGPFELQADDDYPLYAEKMGEAVAAHEGNYGIGICKSGVGMAIALNKVDGVRAAEVYSVSEAKLAKEHDDTNVIVFGSNDFDKLNGFEILYAWLSTNFSGDERHVRRINEVEQYEQQH